jgi:hypothetical protein
LICVAPSVSACFVSSAIMRAPSRAICRSMRSSAFLDRAKALPGEFDELPLASGCEE